MWLKEYRLTEPMYIIIVGYNSTTSFPLRRWLLLISFNWKQERVTTDYDGKDILVGEQTHDICGKGGGGFCYHLSCLPQNWKRARYQIKEELVINFKIIYIINDKGLNVAGIQVGVQWIPYELWGQQSQQEITGICGYTWWPPHLGPLLVQEPIHWWSSEKGTWLNQRARSGASVAS